MSRPRCIDQISLLFIIPILPMCFALIAFLEKDRIWAAIHHKSIASMIVTVVSVFVGVISGLIVSYIFYLYTEGIKRIKMFSAIIHNIDSNTHYIKQAIKQMRCISPPSYVLDTSILDNSVIERSYLFSQNTIKKMSLCHFEVLHLNRRFGLIADCVTSDYGAILRRVKCSDEADEAKWLQSLINGTCDIAENTLKELGSLKEMMESDLCNERNKYTMLSQCICGNKPKHRQY